MIKSEILSSLGYYDSFYQFNSQMDGIATIKIIRYEQYEKYYRYCKIVVFWSIDKHMQEVLVYINKFPIIIKQASLEDIIKWEVSFRQAGTIELYK